ncbi:MAG: GNAT family N-acetyltransferase [Planctomycetes bacterium]|nr:GNAT family N-acetyltransferase [Planctomycetota bacterium]MBL7042569.1 GNAT family N-acetyltransferase [Pirellulaceae bacterium]
MITLHLVVTIADATIRDHFTQLLNSLETTGQLRDAIPRYETKIAFHQTPEDSVQHLQRHFHSVETGAAIVLSDLFEETIGTRSRSKPEPSSWAKDMRDSFQHNPFAMIAITRHRRIPDIDRTIRTRCAAPGLLETVKLATEKTAYLTQPKRQQLLNPVLIREIRANETEMRAYFRLRHRVYKVMGYLEEEVERATSRMEIDWCDTTALHIGAFELVGAQKKLIGCARVMSTGSLEGACSPNVTALANTDATLSRKMETDPMIMRLPIFQSMRSPYVNDLFVETITADKKCGELSRVIVVDKYRGYGLANLLVKFAILRANGRDVERLLLECLQVHERLYNKFGFKKIEGEGGRVIGVEQSMIAMDLHPVATKDVFAGAEIVVEKSCLCACKFRECYTDEYQFYGDRRCPLRHVL